MGWRKRLHYLILLAPLILIWVPFYNRLEPTLGGVPFFYWYQMAWVLLVVIVLAIVWHLDRKARS